MDWISGLEASNRSETVRNRKYARFRIFPMVKKICLAHLTKKLGDFQDLPAAWQKTDVTLSDTSSLSGLQMVTLLNLHVDTWLSPNNKDKDFVDSSIKKLKDLI